MKLPYASLLICAALLAGCSASGPTYNASELQPRNGVRTFQADCQGLLSTSQICTNVARKICGEQPVRVVDSVRAFRDGSDPTSLIFQCGVPPAGAVAIAEPAPAPVSVEHVSIAGDALFASGQATLAPPARVTLDKLLSERKDRAYSYVTVTGHTDSVGSDDYNFALSQRRAEAVADYLKSHGLKAEKLTIAGRGKVDPVASNATVRGRTSNRRVEIVLTR